MKTEVLYTAKEVAEILHCHPQTVYRLAYKGEIKSVKVGSIRRFILPEGTKQCTKDNRF